MTTTVKNGDRELFVAGCFVVDQWGWALEMGSREEALDKARELVGLPPLPKAPQEFTEQATQDPSVKVESET